MALAHLCWRQPVLPGPKVVLPCDGWAHMTMGTTPQAPLSSGKQDPAGEHFYNSVQAR